MLRTIYTRVQQAGPVLAAVVGVVLVGSIVAMLAADLDHKTADDFRYQLADNLTLMAAVLSFILVFVLTGEVDAPSETGSAHRLWLMIVSAGMGMVAAGALILMAEYFYDEMRAYEIVLGLTIGAAVGVTLYNLWRPLVVGDHYRVGWPDLVALLGAFVLLTLVTLGLRWRAAGSDVLTWVVVPLFLFVMPGLSLGFVLLPEETRWLERLLFATPLAIATQLLILMWLTQLDIPITLAVFFLVSSLVNITGFSVAVLQRLTRSNLEAG